MGDVGVAQKYAVAREGGACVCKILLTVARIGSRGRARHAWARPWARVGLRNIAWALVVTGGVIVALLLLLMLLLLLVVVVVAVVVVVVTAVVADALTVVLVRWAGGRQSSPPDHAGVGAQTREGAGSPLAEAICFTSRVYVSVGVKSRACLRLCVRVCVCARVLVCVRVCVSVRDSA